MKSPDVHTVLWDIAPEKVADLPSIFVIQRALAYGNIFLICAIMQKYGAEEMRSAFDAMKPTAMSHRKYGYIKNYLLV